MPRQIESDNSVVVRDRLVAQKVAVLARVGARRVQAEQRNARPRFLDINPARLAVYVHGEIAPGDRLEFRHDSGLLPARAGDDILEVLKVLHQRQQIAVDPRQSLGQHAPNIVIIALRH